MSAPTPVPAPFEGGVHAPSVEGAVGIAITVILIIILVIRILYRRWAYAGKAGIVALSKSLAREVGRFGVTVNVVSPGIVADYDLTIAQARKRKDPETAIGRPGTVQDIANAVAFLCSDEAEFVTGDVLNVTGGWLL